MASSTFDFERVIKDLEQQLQGLQRSDHYLPPWGDWDRQTLEDEAEELLELSEEQPYWLHVKDLLESFAVAVLKAWTFYPGYRVPPNFERVLNYFSQRIQGRFDEQQVVELSVRDYLKMMRSFGAECPEFLAWGEGREGQPCIDHDAVWLNARLYLLHDIALMLGAQMPSVELGHTDGQGI